MKSEGDEESGGRLSSSTEERGAGGRGAVSEAARMEGAVSLGTQEGRYPFGGTLAGHVGDGALGFGLEGWESKAGFGGLPSAVEVGGLSKGGWLVGRGVGRADDKVLSRLCAGKGEGSGKGYALVERCLERSGSGSVVVHLDGVETARGGVELPAVRKGSLDVPSDDECDDQDTRERTREGCRVDR